MGPCVTPITLITVAPELKSLKNKPGSTDCCRHERRQMGAMTRRVMRWQAGRLLSIARRVSTPRWCRVIGMNRWIRDKCGSPNIIKRSAV